MNDETLQNFIAALPQKVADLIGQLATDGVVAPAQAFKKKLEALHKSKDLPRPYAYTVAMYVTELDTALNRVTKPTPAAKASAADDLLKELLKP